MKKQNWFQSPHPTSFNFANQLLKKDCQPEDDNQSRYSLTPFRLPLNRFSPLVQQPKECRLWPRNEMRERNEDSDNRPITKKVVFSESEDQEQQEIQTPKKQHKKNEEHNSTGCKSNGPNVNESRRSRPKEKGLKGISAKALHAATELKSTSYKEVADKLVKQFVLRNQIESEVQATNLKRRVYDALNVLIAAEILKKEGKKILFQSQKKNVRQMETQMDSLKRKIEAKEETMREKKRKLLETHKKLKGISGLLTRNKKNKDVVEPVGQLIRFPFIGVTHFSEWTLEERNPHFISIHFDLIVRPFGDMDSLLHI